MNIESRIQKAAIEGLKHLYSIDANENNVQVLKTKKEFQGHYTIAVFPFLKQSRKSPEATATELGEYLVANEAAVSAFNVIKGFLNLTVAPACWTELLAGINADPHYGITAAADGAPTVMVEFSSPNTNKPLHLGHV
ncbi:MAG TPA: arginine--tRNA ligase, partial [Candidatus Avibacteroides faecavium]|nr:arginine--tRNA ligase [Candidatus Avibacteroides faecavium]